MAEIAQSIDLNLSAKLADREFRRLFFDAETSAHIARQIIALRKRRGLSQVELAAELNTGQPAISRIESADYRSWSYSTLRRVAGVLDGRLRVYIEAAEDVLPEYEAEQEATSAASKAPEPQSVAVWWPEQKVAHGTPLPPSASTTTSTLANVFHGETKSKEQWNLSQSIQPA